MAQQPTPDDDAGERSGWVRRLELLELQAAKLWELFTKAARLDTSVEALRDEVKFLTSMWQQIQDNQAGIEAIRHEVHAVRREKADVAMVRRATAATAAVGVVLLVGVGVVWVGVRRTCSRRRR